MSINFKKYKPNITERREITFKPQVFTKNTVDNSNSIIYNKNKENTLSITPLTDFAKQWKEKNKDALKYAGDSAKKSIHAGLSEAPSFMADADEGTYFGDVQTASVKRHLAKDSNNEKLYNASMMELIGHLSKDNKETYLKHALPLQKYIDAKDEFDFKHNNYTTTDNVDKTPDEKVRQLQRELNESGYTDKFGQRLKEDGIYAGKTAYADDNYKADNPNSSNNYNYSYKTPNITTHTNNISEKDNQNNKKFFSAEDLTYEDYLKIAEYLGYDEDDLDVVKIDITDDGKIKVPQMVAGVNPMVSYSVIYANDVLGINKPPSPEKIKELKNMDRDELYSQIFNAFKKKRESQPPFIAVRNMLKFGTGNERYNDKNKYINYVTLVAEFLKLPVDLALAVTFTESSFEHYEYDKDKLVVKGNGSDYGIMQINKAAHSNAYNEKDRFGDIINNWQDNVNYGLYVLFECYDEAKRRGYTGDELLKATYSNYNSGSCSAYYNPQHNSYKETKEHVENFWSVYLNKSWNN